VAKKRWTPAVRLNYDCLVEKTTGYIATCVGNDITLIPNSRVIPIDPRTFKQIVKEQYAI
jgi:hypothetical protein